MSEKTAVKKNERVEEVFNLFIKHMKEFLKEA
ncbi:catechol 1,2-dioxygenase, partial [Alteribacillus persepolensis]